MKDTIKGICSKLRSPQKPYLLVALDLSSYQLFSFWCDRSHELPKGLYESGADTIIAWYDRPYTMDFIRKMVITVTNMAKEEKDRERLD